jgi:hypothetical protein
MEDDFLFPSRLREGDFFCSTKISLQILSEDHHSKGLNKI